MTETKYRKGDVVEDMILGPVEILAADFPETAEGWGYIVRRTGDAYPFATYLSDDSHIADPTPTVEDFGALLLTATRERLYAENPKAEPGFYDYYAVKIHVGRVYTRVDVGPEFNMSGKYMVENDTGIIFGIKGYGVVHKGHYYGTLAEIHTYAWGGYTARRVVGR